MKKIIHALLGAALAATVTVGGAGTAHAGSSSDRVEERVGYIKPNGSDPYPHLTTYAKRTSLGKEARLRVLSGGSTLRVDKNTLVAYVGSVKLKYIGTAKKKPRTTSAQVTARSSIKKGRYHVYSITVK